MPIFQTVLKIRKHLNSYYHQRICLNCPSHVKIFDPCSLLIFLLDKILDDHIEHRFGAARSQSLRRPCWSCPQRFGWGRRWSWIGGGGGSLGKSWCQWWQLFWLTFFSGIASLAESYWGESGQIWFSTLFDRELPGFVWENISGIYFSCYFLDACCC